MRDLLAITLKRTIYSTVAIVTVLSLMPPSQLVKALRLDNISVVIGSSAVNAITTQGFAFDYNTPAVTGSVKFEYCTNSPLFEVPCVAPIGFDATNANLDSQTGETGFSIVTPGSANEIIITRSATPVLAVPATYNFSNITNPSTPGETVYVRISTYASEDATGASTDRAVAAFSTANQIAVEVFVPPYIAFCIGITVSHDCSVTSGNYINLGELSSSVTRFATSQFAVSTNDPAGYVVSIHGTTMTSGNNVIPANNPQSPSIKGKSQFGINLRANSNPSVGHEPSGVGSGVVKPAYATPNQFYFSPDSLVASSPLPTDYTVFTASYVVNVSSVQPTGVYSTTSSYIATAAF